MRQTAMDIYKTSSDRKWYGAPTEGLEAALLEGQRFVVVFRDHAVKVGDTLVIKDAEFLISHIAKPYPWNPEDTVPTGGVTLSLVRL